MRKTQNWIWVGFIIYLICAVTNIGFIAVDDYHHGIVHFIPAQKRTVAHIIEVSGFRSPVPNLFLFGLARLGLFLGASEPANQLRFINVMLACLAQLAVFSVVGIFRLGGQAMVDAKKTSDRGYFNGLLLWQRPFSHTPPC